MHYNFVQYTFKEKSENTGILDLSVQTNTGSKLFQNPTPDLQLGDSEYPIELEKWNTSGNPSIIFVFFEECTFIPFNGGSFCAKNTHIFFS